MPIERSFDNAIARCSPTVENVLITAAGKFGHGRQFESLWQDSELSDVTLVCNDGSQVKAHKTVLALSSPLLRDILTKSKRHDPILLLPNVGAQELENILKLIYLGEVSLSSTELDSFLSAAQYLKLSLLQPDNVSQQFQPEKQTTSSKGSDCQRNQNLDSDTSVLDKTGYVKTEDTDFDGKSGRNGLNCSTDSHETSEIQLDSPLLQNKCKQINTRNICNECGKEFEAFNHLWVHIQADHQGMHHRCKICRKTYVNATGLKEHTDSAHKGIHPVCHDCGHKFSTNGSLSKHIKRVHAKK